MNLLLSDPAFLSVAATVSGGGGYDADAQAYITAVETADAAAGSPGGLETAVKDAINAFVVGCKADGIWNAIKASCILAGARTLSGALVPLAGTAPTNYNFVAGDYNRKTGLVGDGITKYLNSNRNNNADPQDSKHAAVYATTLSTSPVGFALIGTEVGSVSGSTQIAQTTQFVGFRVNSSNNVSHPSTPTVGLVGGSRSNSANFSARNAGSTSFLSAASQAPTNRNISIYTRTDNPAQTYVNARLAFYSIGESLDLALLDARVTTLINAFAAAIP